MFFSTCLKVKYNSSPETNPTNLMFFSMFSSIARFTKLFFSEPDPAMHTWTLCIDFLIRGIALNSMSTPFTFL